MGDIILLSARVVYRMEILKNVQNARNKTGLSSLFPILVLLLSLRFWVSFSNGATTNKSSGFEILLDNVLDAATVVFWFSVGRDVRFALSIIYRVFQTTSTLGGEKNHPSSKSQLASPERE